MASPPSERSEPRPVPVGFEAEVIFEVDESMCPAFDGVVVHRVCSTWTLGHQMELAARRVLLPHLTEGLEGIGAHLSIDHVGPAPVGSTVRVVARAVETDPTTVVCEVVAYDGRPDRDRVIGRGRQVQRVLPKSRLDALIARAAD